MAGVLASEMRSRGNHRIQSSTVRGSAGDRGSDPIFCSSFKSILAATPKDKWPSSTGPVLEWDGGSAVCHSTTDGKQLSCPVYNEQMLSGCTLFERPSAAESAADAAAREYAHTRLMPAINACFTGAAAEAPQESSDSRIFQGYKIAPPGLAPFRIGDGRARVGTGNSMCGFEFVEFVIDVVP